jgi:hypothetical protein
MGTGPAGEGSSSHPVSSIMILVHSTLIGLTFTGQALETAAKQKKRSKKPAAQPIRPSIQRTDKMEPLCALPKMIQQRVSCTLIIFDI